MKRTVLTAQAARWHATLPLAGESSWNVGVDGTRSDGASSTGRHGVAMAGCEQWERDLQGYTVVFDLDGTLIETAPDLIAATNHVLAHAGLPAVPGDAIRSHISFGAKAMIREGFRLNGRTVEPVEASALLGRFLEHYSANIAANSHPFPGLIGSLDELAARGARLAVCTNKQEAPARKLLAALGLADRFAAIAGRDTFPVCKPHPDHLTGVVRQAGGTLDRAIMIGDSATDIETARAAGVPVIAVSFGYTDVPVHALGPDAVIGHYDELLPALARIGTCA